MTFILYQATNQRNGKRYIGYTSRGLATRKRWHAECAKYTSVDGAFQRAIRKYGIDTFDFLALEMVSSKSEAAALEIKLIADLRPEYNSTKGGGGCLGLEWSAESREKIAASKRGNTYRKGKTHTDKVRAILSEYGTMRVGLFRQFTHLGPAAIARPVVCLDDGMTYSSASDAARAYGAAKSALIELCLGKRGRKTVGGRRFAYADVQ